MSGQILFMEIEMTDLKLSEQDQMAIDQYLNDAVNKPVSTPSCRKKSLKQLNSNLKKLDKSIENLRYPDGHILELSKVRVQRKKML